MDGEPVTLATVPAAAGSRLHISFGLGNELHVIDLNASSKQESTASIVQWGAQSAGQRRICYDSQGQYQALHQRGLDPLSPEAWAHTLQYSRTVSAILAADGVRGSEATPEELLTLQERALWDLLSLFFLESANSASGAQAMAAQDLARWLRTHPVAVAGSVAAQPLPPRLVAALKEAALPEALEQYWPAVQRLVALGWIDDAVELLGLHSAWARYDFGSTADLAAADDVAGCQLSALDAATVLLRKFPTLCQPGVQHGGVGRECSTTAELLQYRRTWQAQCAALLADAAMWRQCKAGDIATAAGLRGLLSALAGEESALAAATSNWLELLVAELLHIYPAAKPQAELRQLAQRCFEAGGGAAAPEFLQVASALLDACCELDAQACMRVCSAYCSDWFMAHAPDLMAAHPAGAGVLGRELPHLGGSQVEFYTLEYAAAMMPHAATWPTAAAYLAWCPAHGAAALAALLRRLPLVPSQPWVARKAAEVAQYHGLARVAEDVYRAQGVLSWQAGQLGTALSWLAKAGDVRRINIALQPLAYAVSEGTLSAEQAAALEVLQPVLEVLPPGSANAALLAVHRLLTQGSQPAAAAAGAAAADAAPNSGGGGGGRMRAAVAALAQLPQAMRDSCLQLVCGAVPAMPPGLLSEADVLYLLQWLLSAEARLGAGPGSRRLAASIQVARLALVRSLAASHMKQRPAAAHTQLPGVLA